MKKTLFALLVCMAPLCVLAQLPSYLPTDGLVGWWPFNGNANDESGNGNDGVVNGAILTSDRFGNANKAYSFDGVDDYVLNNSNTGLGLNSRTIDFWMKTTGASLNPQVLIDEGGSICGSGFAIVNLNPSNFLRFDNSCSYKDMTSPFGLNQWINVVIVFDNSISNGLSGVKFYINGNLIINYSTLNGANLNINSGNSFPLTFAKSRLENNYFFSGELDDIAIYNRALSPEEITALYTATPTNGGGGNNTTSANVPQGISYQAVARNPQGQPLTNTALQVKFTLLSDSLTGTTEYAELHSLTTNDLGLFTTAFGTGTPLSGTFANINWASGNKYLKVEMDAVGGFIALGTQQMLSVPYSMRSQTSATIQNNALPVYSDNAAALAGGLQAGQMYRTAAGVLMVVY
jgi:hypothetical protein